MKYGIAVSKEAASAYDNRVLIGNEINPFSEEYYYSDSGVELREITKEEYDEAIAKGW